MKNKPDFNYFGLFLRLVFATVIGETVKITAYDKNSRECLRKR